VVAQARLAGPVKISGDIDIPEGASPLQAVVNAGGLQLTAPGLLALSPSSHSVAQHRLV
jgi:hypothetical protein